MRMRVVHMEESLRGRGMIYESSGFKIESQRNPEVDPGRNTLYIRGVADDADEITSTIAFPTQEAANEYIENVRRGVSSINCGVDMSRA